MTSRETHPIIAKEGWPHVVIAAGLALLATWLLCWWSIPFWLLLVFVVQFFRDPRRVIPTAPGIVVAPADGRIVMVGRARDPYLDRDALKISIFMNVFNVHSNRSPVDALVRKRWYHPGSFLNAALDKASAENERMALHLRTPDGIDITCVQIAGLVARRILCYTNESDSLARGQRYGFIRFGSRVDLYLPTTATTKVSVGDVTMGGVTSVAELNG
jgi:phosphatidylserine decarboxylase